MHPITAQHERRIRNTRIFLEWLEANKVPTSAKALRDDMIDIALVHIEQLQRADKNQAAIGADLAAILQADDKANRILLDLALERPALSDLELDAMPRTVIEAIYLVAKDAAEHFAELKQDIMPKIVRNYRAQ